MNAKPVTTDDVEERWTVKIGTGQPWAADVGVQLDDVDDDEGFTKGCWECGQPTYDGKESGECLTHSTCFKCHATPIGVVDGGKYTWPYCQEHIGRARWKATSPIWAAVRLAGKSLGYAIVIIFMFALPVGIPVAVLAFLLGAI